MRGRVWGAGVGLAVGWASVAPGQPTGTETPREPVAVLAAVVPVATPLERYAEVEIAGFTVFVDPELRNEGRSWARVRAALLFDLDLVAERLPGAALEGVRRTPIVATRLTPARPDWDGGSAACLHVSAEWLVAHGYDEARAGVVEILNAEKYLSWRAEQPFMLLHELAHAHHLGIGYGDARVIGAFEGAMAGGLYERVGHVMSPEGGGVRAYAASNPQEYFAELSEAYFGRNDFYPFTREDLAAHDPEGLAMVEELWGITPAERAVGAPGAGG